MNYDGYKETEIGPIPEDWDFISLNKVCNINMGQSPSSKFYNVEGIGLPFFQGRKDFGDKYPKVTMWCSEPNKIAKKGDVLVSVRAPVGDVNVSLEQCCIGRGLSSVTMKNNNNEFLFYLFLYSKQRLKDIFDSEGTVFGCITKKGLNDFKVPFPSLNEQGKIASILSALDNKIELNHQMNQTLESIGQAIFRYWFVHFEFPNGEGRPYKSSGGEMVYSELGEIPIGWEVGKLKDVGKIVCGKTPPKSRQEYFGGEVPFIKIPDMHGKTFVVKTEDSLTQEGKKFQKNKTLPANSVCISCIATVGLVCIIPQESQTNQQINSIIPQYEFFTPYLYYKMSSMKDFIEILASGGSATLNLNTKNFSNIDIIIPSDEVLKKYYKIVKLLFDQILNNQIQNEALSQLRDSLLLKLMSGNIRVNMPEEATVK